MPDKRPLVDKNKNILVHQLEDLRIKFSPGPSIASFAGRDLRFEVIGKGISIPLIANPDNAQGAIISVTSNQLSSVGPVARFAVVDRTSGASDTLWAGRLERYL